MKFLKNNLKLIIGLIVGAILAGGIVYAAISAREVTYTTSKNAQVQTVADALNDLYKNKKETFTKVATDLSSRYDQTVNLTNLPNYTELTTDNFFIDKKTLVEEKITDRGSVMTMSVSYDKETGILSLGKFKTFYSDTWVFYTIYDVYIKN